MLLVNKWVNEWISEKFREGRELVREVYMMLCFFGLGDWRDVWFFFVIVGGGGGGRFGGVRRGVSEMMWIGGV